MHPIVQFCTPQKRGFAPPKKEALHPLKKALHPLGEQFAPPKTKGGCNGIIISRLCQKSRYPFGVSALFLFVGRSDENRGEIRDVPRSQATATADWLTERMHASKPSGLRVAVRPPAPTKKSLLSIRTKGTFLSDAFLAERDAHCVRDAGFARDARLRRVCGTHRITYHSEATSRITYLQTYQYTEKLCGNIRRLLIASCRTAKEKQ